MNPMLATLLLQIPEQVAPEIGYNRKQRPEVQRHVEGQPETVLVEAEEVLAQEQVPRARYRQELREPLHHAQYDGLKEFEHV